jgi:hypothetical protein
MRKTAILAGLLVAAALAALAISTGFSQTASPGRAESLEAWRKIATVLQHPRCLNCHQLNAPLQGDSRRLHVPRVSRGSDNHGVSAMLCGNCHNDMGNNPTSGTPGAGQPRSRHHDARAPWRAEHKNHSRRCGRLFARRGPPALPGSMILAVDSCGLSRSCVAPIENAEDVLRWNFGAGEPDICSHTACRVQILRQSPAQCA